ncbi:DUF2235 domain-containing protein, partial [Pontiella sp.]|uniref:DUF2235 domain-containing protein n=1 Tax=Pontiella sp. TaxID=2837462 RepID=UPI003562ADC3
MNKRLIVCCDGTWNDLEMRYITNVGRLVQCMLPTGQRSDGTEIQQFIYYDDGVGADSKGLHRFLEGGFGRGMDNLIYEAYRFICINYEKDDELLLYGFSRGAYTVRSLAGMINKIGLVQRDNLKYVPQALEAYRDNKSFIINDSGNRVVTLNVKIDLLGCWDTVGAMGIPDKLPWLPIDKLTRKKYKFHSTEIGSNIKRALHAVAIDERRKEFQATLMQKASNAPASQKLIQTWFPGDHGCVGGGSWEKRGLSNHCLKWMIDQTVKLGIKLGTDLNRLHDQAISDESIFFPREKKWIYSSYDRPMPPHSVSWEDIDVTARNRWAEHSNYRPSKLKSRFAEQLNNHTSTGGRIPPTTHTELDDGESACCRVHSEKKDNRSKIIVKKGSAYEIEIPRVQVWKDGDLDPCDVRGWNCIKSGAKAKHPYEDGKPADL